MAARSVGDTSRKPSGSSTHSGAHSPSSSPHNPQQRLAPSGASNMFGVGVGTPGTLKPLNGWQVWNSTTPAKRNPSASSATSVAADIPSPLESNFRGNLGEGWVSSRPSSGNWDESGSPHKQATQLDPHSSLSLHQVRQRQAAVHAASLSAPRMDERSPTAKQGQFSPQRYAAGLVKDPSRYTASSPTRAAGFTGNLLQNQQAVLQGSSSSPGRGYENLQTNSVVEGDLALGLRGMVVEDDYNTSPSNGQYRQQSSQHNQANGAILRGLPPMQPPRVPYSAYVGTDYSAYYSNQPGVEYPYGYASPDVSLYGASPGGSASLYSGLSPQSLHPSAVSQQSGMFYDYVSSVRPPGSQFYYPPQLLYHPSASPLVSSQLSSANSLAFMDRKRDLQYNVPQHPQMAYASGLDFGSQLPVLLPSNGLYNPNGNSAVHSYGAGVRTNRRRTPEAAATLRSAVLEEFRASKSRQWELRDIFGYIVEFSGDQHGSRFIQQRLESATNEEKQIIFDEIVPNNALQLIQDVFGNYVIQKLFEHGTQVQKTLLANTMEGHILPLSMQMYGCRVVQKAIEHILPDQQAIFVKELEPHVLRCVKDANGNHVIQKIVERVPADKLAFVNTFRGNVYDLATHPYGCRVLQRCFEHLPEDLMRPLLDELHRYTINLMQDQFGNYVVQFVLEHGKPQDKAHVITKLRGQMLQMARHKFASNVCEKALTTTDPENRRLLIDELMIPKADGVNPVVTMMKDQFANYVLQRALVVAEGEQKDGLINKVKPQLASMRRYSSAYSKHLISIERLIERCGTVQKEEPTTSSFEPGN